MESLIRCSTLQAIPQFQANTIACLGSCGGCTDWVLLEPRAPGGFTLVEGPAASSSLFSIFLFGHPLKTPQLGGAQCVLRSSRPGDCHCTRTGENKERSGKRDEDYFGRDRILLTGRPSSCPLLVVEQRDPSVLLCIDQSLLTA